MRNIITLSLALLLTINSFFAKANVAAGDITYEYISDSTYRFFVKIFWDCKGGTEPSSVTLCIKNPCNNTTQSFTVPKYIISNNKIGPGCPNIKTQCDSIASTVAGYYEFWYTYTYTLPSKCDAWKAYTFLPRNNPYNINPGQPLYLETTFNNTISDTNSSPYFLLKAIEYIPSSQSHLMKNLQAVDVDGDSLFAEILSPKTGLGTCQDTGKAVTLPAFTPPITFPGNPMQTNNQFILNGYSHLASLVSVMNGIASVDVRIKEYRKGKLIGTVIREVQAQTLPVASSNRATVKIGCGTPTSSVLYMCYNTPYSYCLDFISTNPNGAIDININKSPKMGTANIVVTNNSTDSVHVSIVWTPGISDTGLHNIRIDILDRTCIYPGIPLSYSYSLPINVWPPTRASLDDTICSNGYAFLSASGGGDFKWTILPGGTPNSVNPINATNTIARPDTTTSYVVTSNMNAYCPYNNDTVTISVLPDSLNTTPSISIKVQPDSIVQAGTAITFTALDSGCKNPSYQWLMNGTIIPLANGKTYTANNIPDSSVITCKLTCNDTCPAPKDTLSNRIKIFLLTGTQMLSLNNIYRVYPNPNNGSFYISSGTLSENNIHIRITNTLGQVVHQQKGIVLQVKPVEIRSNLSPGMYYLEINNGESQNITPLLIQ